MLYINPCDSVLTGVLDFGWQAGIDSLLVDF